MIRQLTFRLRSADQERSGFSDFLYGPWFAPMIGVLVVAVVVGLVVLVAR